MFQQAARITCRRDHIARLFRTAVSANRQQRHLISTATLSTASKPSRKNQSTINEREVAKFASSDWWGTASADTNKSEHNNVGPLHAMQPLRMRLLREAIDKHMPGRDITSLRVLDVGCGGGLMSEAMAELGAHVTAVDPSLNNIEAARKHLPIELAGRVNYQQATAEEVLAREERFDIVYSLEVIEHVDNQEHFLETCIGLLKDDGLFAMSTMNRTLRSLGLAIVAAEYVMGMVPPGTHDWTKFISPEQVQRVIHECDNGSIVHTVDVAGMIYNPLTRTWHENRMDTDVNYILIARKSSKTKVDV